MPPRWLRRLLLGPAVLLAVAWALLSLPLAVLAALLMVPFVAGRWRPLRLLWFALVYLLLEAAGVLAAFGLWLASGCGWKLRSARFQKLHYGLLRVCLGLLVRAARRIFTLVLAVDEDDLHAVDARGRTPIVVLCRHAGPGDSFLLVADLLRRGWRPRIVLKAALQWDPLLDVTLNRLPCRFVPPSRAGRAESVAAIAGLAASMGPDDALVIFPEGGNYTPARRYRSIVKLTERGLHAEADRARSLRHVLAPRAAGTLAALSAAPQAEVVFVAHTGLEDLSTPVDLWHGLPIGAEVHAKAWRVYPDDVPDRPEEQATWLYSWWLRIDAWIVRQRGAARVPDAVAKRLRGLPGLEFDPDDIGT